MGEEAKKIENAVIQDHDPLTFYKHRHDLGMDQYIDMFAKGLITLGLSANDWNVAKAAKFLKVPRTTLRLRIEKLGIERTNVEKHINTLILERARLEGQLRFIDYFLEKIGK